MIEKDDDVKRLGDFEIDKIYCGDALELLKKLPDKSIDLVYTDPPYKYTTGKNKKANFDFEKRVIDLMTKSKLTETQAKIWAGKERSRNEILSISNGFNLEILNELCRVMKYIYIYGVQNGKLAST